MASCVVGTLSLADTKMWIHFIASKNKKCDFFFIYLRPKVLEDNFSSSKIICHRNFGNEVAFTYSKDYLIILLSYRYLTMKLSHRI